MMYEIKGMYVLIDDIKHIYYSDFTKGTVPMLVINYRFDDKPIEIDVDSREEYEVLATLLADEINGRNKLNGKESK